MFVKAKPISRHPVLRTIHIARRKWHNQLNCRSDAYRFASADSLPCDIIGACLKENTASRFAHTSAMPKVLRQCPPSATICRRRRASTQENSDSQNRTSTIPVKTSHGFSRASSSTWKNIQNGEMRSSSRRFHVAEEGLPHGATLKSRIPTEPCWA